MQKNSQYALDLRDIVQLNIKSLELFGYFCPDFKKTLPKILYYVYRFLFVGSAYVLFLISEMINMILMFGDIEKMTEASFLFLTHLVQTMKLYVLFVHTADVRRLIRSINRQEFKPRNEEQYNLLKDDIKMSRLITKVFFSMCCATCFLWGIFPFLDRGEEGIRLPLSAWFPFDTKRSPIFECVFAYLTIGSLINGLGNISIDTLMSGLIMFISGQLKILNNAFENIEVKLENDQEQSEVRTILIRNILHHKNIIKFADNVTALFTSCIMGQFVVSVIIICITMFQMSLVPVTSLQFLSMVLYQGCMVLEIFLWCYYGNEIILQSSKLTRSAYMCQWLDCDKVFKKDLMYFMMHSQIPLKLYAGNYFTLSLETFMAIVKSSWSYFAVLNRVHSDTK